MRVTLRLLILLFLVTALRGGAVADGNRFTEQVDTLFAPWNRPDSPGCALAVVRDGKVVLERGYGMANLEYSIPIQPDTRFHIASTSKQFTAFAIQLLVNEGKLSLDDDVRKYLPELHFFGKTITIRRLLHHSSGLRDQWSLLTLAGWRMQDVITEQDILNLLSRQKELNFEPGAEYLYCNSGYTLLGIIVKRVSGKSLDQFCQERIFRPLAMNHTEFHDDNEKIVPGRAYSYHPTDAGGFANSPLQYAVVGATSLFTTVDDLARWDENFYTARVGGQRVIDAMLEPGKLNNGKVQNYACGLILGDYRGLKTVEHDGADAGYRATLLRFPQPHFSVILLSNLATIEPNKLARRVADLYLQDVFQSAPPASAAPPAPAPVAAPDPLAADRKAVIVDPKVYDTYVGVYQLSPRARLTVTNEHGRLMGQATGQGKTELLPSSETEFSVKGADVQATFVKDPDGAVNTVILRLSGQNHTAKRVAQAAATTASLAEYAGTYYSDELDVLYTLEVRDGSLWLHHPRREFELEPQAADEFNTSVPIGHIRFARNAAGHLTEMFISSGRVRNLRFARVDLRGVQ